MKRFLGPRAGHLTILAFPDGGGGGGGSLIVVKPGGEQLNLSLGTKWPCHCKETGTRTHHRLMDRSNVASCAMMDDQISVIGKYLSSICVIVVHPLSILISEDIFRNRFCYGSFVRFVDLIATIVSFVSRKVSEFCIIYFQNTCVSMKDDRLVQTANYVVTANFTVISEFRYLFFDVFCVPGVGTLNLI